MPIPFQDLRYALRQARRSPGFFACAASLIAIGIAANTLIFTLINALLLRPLPVREPQNLVQLFSILPKLPPGPYYDYRFYRQLAGSSTTLFGVVGHAELPKELQRGASVERAHVEAVTDNYFRELGVQPLLGRLLVVGESVAGDGHAAVLSYLYWARSFGRDPKAIGQTIRLHGISFTVVGVAAREFTGTTVDSSPDLWIPFTTLPDISTVRNPDLGVYQLEIIARVRPGIQIQRAQQEAALFRSRYLKEQSGKSLTGYLSGTMEVRSIAHGLSPMREQCRAALMLLVAGAGVLLLMVSANVGGLLLARSAAREKETAIRLAIGASRARLIRQNLTDALLLTVCGGSVGWLLAAGAAPLLVRLLPPARGIGFDPQEIRDLALDLHLDLTVAGFSLAICAVTAVLCALAPAWRSTRSDAFMALKSVMSDVRHRRFQSVLCGFQVALCTLLLFCAGLMGRTLASLRSSDTGFSSSKIAIFSMDPHVGGLDSRQAYDFRNRLLDSVKKLAGVEGAAISARALMRGTGLVNQVVLPGDRFTGVWNSSFNSVTTGYFDVMGIRRLAGRGFRESDLLEEGKPTQTIVNEAFVEKFLRGRDAIGARFGAGPQYDQHRFEIIGVVSDTKYRSLREVPPPIYYTCDFGPQAYPDTFILHVRTHEDPRAIMQPVRRLVSSIDARVPIYQVATLSQEIDHSLWRERLLAGLAACFGLFAMLLSAIGIFGILAYFVARRQREIGVRMALGAQPTRVVWLIARRVTPSLCIGLLAGAVLSALASQWVRNLLFGVQPFDPLSAGVALLLIVSVGAAGSVAPALRAVRIDPASSLRQE